MSGTVSLRITLRYKDLDEFVARYAENISSAGLFLRTRTPKPTGTRIRFELLLVDGAQALLGEGVVVAVRHDDKPGMAIRFHTLEPDARAVVDRVVSAHGEGALAPTPLGGALARPGAGTFSSAWKSAGPAGWSGSAAARATPVPSSGGLLPAAGASWARRPAGEGPVTPEKPENKAGIGGSPEVPSTVPGSSPSGRPRRRGSSVLRPWATDESPAATEIVRPLDPLARRDDEGPAPRSTFASLLEPRPALDEATARIDLPAAPPTGSPWSTPPTRLSAPVPSEPEAGADAAWPSVALLGTEEAHFDPPMADSSVVIMEPLPESPAVASDPEREATADLPGAREGGAREPSTALLPVEVEASSPGGAEPPTTAMRMEFDEAPAAAQPHPAAERPEPEAPIEAPAHASLERAAGGPSIDDPATPVSALPSSIDVDLASLMVPAHLEVPEPVGETDSSGPGLADASWASAVGPATVRPTPLDEPTDFATRLEVPDDDDHLRPIASWRVSDVTRAREVEVDEAIVGAESSPVAPVESPHGGDASDDDRLGGPAASADGDDLAVERAAASSLDEQDGARAVVSSGSSSSEGLSASSVAASPGSFDEQDGGQTAVAEVDGRAGPPPEDDTAERDARPVRDAHEAAPIASTLVEGEDSPAEAGVPVEGLAGERAASPLVGDPAELDRAVDAGPAASATELEMDPLATSEALAELDGAQVTADSDASVGDGALLDTPDEPGADEGVAGPGPGAPADEGRRVAEGTSQGGEDRAAAALDPVVTEDTKRVPDLEPPAEGDDAQSSALYGPDDLGDASPVAQPAGSFAAAGPDDRASARGEPSGLGSAEMRASLDQAMAALDAMVDEPDPTSHAGRPGATGYDVLAAAAAGVPSPYDAVLTAAAEGLPATAVEEAAEAVRRSAARAEPELTSASLEAGLPEPWSAPAVGPVTAEPTSTAEAVPLSPLGSGRAVALDVRAIDDGEAVLAPPVEASGAAFVDDAFSDALEERDRAIGEAPLTTAEAVSDLVARESTGRAARTGELVIEPTIRLDVPRAEAWPAQARVEVDPELDVESAVAAAPRGEGATEHIAVGVLATEPRTMRLETSSLDEGPTGRLSLGAPRPFASLIEAAVEGMATPAVRPSAPSEPSRVAPVLVAEVDADAYQTPSERRSADDAPPGPRAELATAEEGRVAPADDADLAVGRTAPAFPVGRTPPPRSGSPFDESTEAGSLQPAGARSPFDESTEVGGQSGAVRAISLRDETDVPAAAPGSRASPAPDAREGATPAPLPSTSAPAREALRLRDEARRARGGAAFDEATEAELRVGAPLPAAVIPVASAIPSTEVVRPGRLAASSPTELIRPSAPPPPLEAPRPATSSVADLGLEAVRAAVSSGLLAPAPLTHEDGGARAPAAISEAKVTRSAEGATGRVTVTGVSSEARASSASAEGREARAAESPPAEASDARFVAFDLSDRLGHAGGLVRGRYVPLKVPACARVALGEDGTVASGADADALARTRPGASVRVRALLLSMAGVSSEVAIEEVDGRRVVRLDGQAVELSEVLRACLAPLADVVPRGASRARALLVTPAPLSAELEAVLGQSARTAGVDVLEVVAAPVAAARAFGLESQPVESVLVVEVAEEHLTISVLRRARDGLRAATVRPLDGPSVLDFDRTILEFAKAELERVAPGTRLDAAMERQLVGGLEKLRADLRKESMVELRARDVTLKLPRLKLYQATEGLVARIAQLVRETLGEAGVHPRAIGAVVLVGAGGALAPIAQALSALTTHDPQAGLEPTEILQAGFVRVVESHAARERTTRADALELDIGIGLPGGRFHALLGSGTKLPAKVSRKHATTRDGQTELVVGLYEGRGEQIARCTSLGSVTLEGLPKDARGAVQVEVEMSLDDDAVLTVELTEPRSGARNKLTVATAQTPAARREALGASVEAAPVAKPKAKGGFFSRLLGRS